MNKFFVLLLVLLLRLWSVGVVYAQGGPHEWRFGNPASVTFSGLPLPVGNPPGNSQFRTNDGCASVCNSRGQLLFSTNGYWVYDRFDQRMPSFSGNSPYNPIMTWAGTEVSQSALIVPFPRDTNRFYLFSMSVQGQLSYSVIDMSLHNGLGDIVPGKKGVFLDYGLCSKLSAAAGCNNVWVVVRSRTANTYKAFSITEKGIDTTPVISHCGFLSPDKYLDGVIKFSPDGRKMAAACHNYSYAGGMPVSVYGGLELYDFDLYSGRVFNPLLLDTNGVWYGACFSGGGSKLYASAMLEKKVYQWDMSQLSPGAVLASRTLVLTNPNYYTSVGTPGWSISIPVLGDLQRGPDGKVYIGNNTSIEQRMVSQGVFSGRASFLHVFHQPDLPGLACNPQTDAVDLHNRRTNMGLPNDIVRFPVQDTLYTVRHIRVCYADSVLLEADRGKQYHWDDGSVHDSRVIRQPGTYRVNYTDTSCLFRIDSFKVDFVRIPVISNNPYACPGKGQGMVWVTPADTVNLFAYSWKDSTGNILKTSSGRSSDTISGLFPGTYYLHFSINGACDSFLVFQVKPLPQPVASFVSAGVVCKGDTAAFVNTSGQPLQNWSISDGTESAAATLLHVFQEKGLYKVRLIVTNVEGCSDTVYRNADVRELNLFLYADPESIPVAGTARLYTIGSASYQVTAWLPPAYFPVQNVREQYLSLLASEQFTVVGVSDDGCRDTASLTVDVIPQVRLPSAFSPNADGRNDVFRPILSGGDVRIIRFAVYDRWGKQVWTSFSGDPGLGWDGTYHGNPVEPGTYYYYLVYDNGSGPAVNLKGDVTLLR